jgi:hypothetical protein
MSSSISTLVESRKLLMDKGTANLNCSISFAHRGPVTENTF